MNPSPSEPSRLEPVPVQLTRMEGTINLIAYRVSTGDPEGNRCDAVITSVQGDEVILALDSDSFASSTVFQHASA